MFNLCYFIEDGISSKYLPLSEIFSFHFLMSMIFVACILSSRKIALKGLQKREWIVRVLFLLKMKRRGGDWLRNIRPVAFWIIVVRGFASIVFFFPLM